MTTSAHREFETWELLGTAEDGYQPDPDYDSELAPQSVDDSMAAEWVDDQDWIEAEDSVAVEYDEQPGINGRAVVLLTSVSLGAVTVLNLALTGGKLTFFFDLCFIVISLCGAMAVRRRDLFTAGVLPPIAFAAVIGIVAVAAPEAITAGARVDKVFLSGLADHAFGLVAGYGAALLAVAARASVSPNGR